MSLLRDLRIYNDGSVEVVPIVNPPLPAIQLWRMKQDDQIEGYVRGPGNANVPAVFRMEPFHFTPLTKEWQFYLFGLNRGNDWETDYHDFIVLLNDNKAFSNGHGIFENNVQVGRDYIGDTGRGLPDPAWATLVCANNVMTGKEVKLSTKTGNYKPGTWVLEIQTMRAPNSGITRATHPELIHLADTITHVTSANGFWQVNPFPERGGRDGMDVHYPLISSKQVYIRLDWLEKLPLGSEIPPVYNPA